MDTVHKSPSSKLNHDRKEVIKEERSWHFQKKLKLAIWGPQIGEIKNFLTSKSRAVAIQNYMPSNAKPPEGSQWEGSDPLELLQNVRKRTAGYFDRAIGI